jgi:tagatose 6-phosphate kinase
VLLVVCPNLAIDRVLEVDNFQANKVQRTHSTLTQPGGKGSNVARVFRQLGGDVVLVGFLGRANAARIREPLRNFGIRLDAVIGFPQESRTCTIVCDKQSRAHPTVINEESPQIADNAAANLFEKVSAWIPRVDAVLATGSMSRGLPDDFYAQILELARAHGKVTALDATGEALRLGLLARPVFMKPNTDEFFQLVRPGNASGIFTLPAHSTFTFGKAGALLIHDGQCLYARPPRLFDVNPIGAGDAFTAGYLKYLLDRRPASECFRFAMAAAASDAATLRPGFIDVPLFEMLSRRVELRFL